MTNTIQFPVNPLTKYPSSVFGNSDTSVDQSVQDFGGLLSTMLTSSVSLPGMETSSSGSGDMTTLLMLLISKLLGDENSSLLPESTPEGNPLQGVITQDSHTGHIALDYGVPVGTKVHSTMSGKVVYAGWNNEGYGNLVIVENGDYKTYYAHLSNIPVKVGQTISEGQIIGLSGNTGNSTGPHLHYEIRKNGIQIDPTTTIKS